MRFCSFLIALSASTLTHTSLDLEAPGYGSAKGGGGGGKIGPRLERRASSPERGPYRDPPSPKSPVAGSAKGGAGGGLIHQELDDLDSPPPIRRGFVDEFSRLYGEGILLLPDGEQISPEGYKRRLDAQLDGHGLPHIPVPDTEDGWRSFLYDAGEGGEGEFVDDGLEGGEADYLVDEFGNRFDEDGNPLDEFGNPLTHDSTGFVHPTESHCAHLAEYQERTGKLIAALAQLDSFTSAFGELNSVGLDFSLTNFPAYLKEMREELELSRTIAQDEVVSAERALADLGVSPAECKPRAEPSSPVLLNRI